MRKLSLIITLLAISESLWANTLQERIKNISKSEMQAVIEFLGHDLLEGRAPGTRGGDLTEIYMKSLFKLLGFAPGVNGDYLQPFNLRSSVVEKMEITAGSVPLIFGQDLVGAFVGKQNNYSLQAEAVFVGFGIKTKIWTWDDYKDTDVTNKIVIARINDPGMVHPDIFEGRILSYFGRMTSRVYEAARRGASGIIFIHSKASSNYTWDFVKNSQIRERLFLNSDSHDNFLFSAFFTEKTFKKVLKSQKIKLKDLYARSEKRDFRPIPLGFSIKIKGRTQSRNMVVNNVIARIPGKSPRSIVLSAHIDHLGKNDALKGDNIFNGAIDNASAVASMLITAKILNEFRDRLAYSVVLLACHAEESGLLGSAYYVQNADRKNLIANINFESTPVWEKASSIMAIGGRYSTFEDMLKRLTKQHGLKYSRFSMVDQGFFFRSDQFSFAQYGIPAIWISAGEDDASGTKRYNRFWKTDYHTVDDEYDPQWKLEGMKQTIKFALLLIDHINKHKQIPQWKNNLTFPQYK